MDAARNIPREIRRTASLNALKGKLDLAKKERPNQKEVINAISKQAIKLALKEAKSHPLKAKQIFNEIKESLDELEKKPELKTRSIFEGIFRREPPRFRTLQKIGKLEERSIKPYTELAMIGEKLGFGYKQNVGIFALSQDLFLASMEKRLEHEATKNPDRKTLRDIRKGQKLIDTLRKQPEQPLPTAQYVLKIALANLLKEFEIPKDEIYDLKTLQATLKGKLSVSPPPEAKIADSLCKGLAMIDLLDFKKTIALLDRYEDQPAIELKTALNNWHTGKMTNIDLSKIKAFLRHDEGSELKERASMMLRIVNDIFDWDHDKGLKVFFATAWVADNKNAFMGETDFNKYIPINPELKKAVLKAQRIRGNVVLDELGKHFNYRHDDVFFEGHPALFVAAMEKRLQREAALNPDDEILRDIKNAQRLIIELRVLPEQPPLTAPIALKAKLRGLLGTLSMDRSEVDNLERLKIKLEGQPDAKLNYVCQCLAIIDLMEKGIITLLDKYDDKPALDLKAALMSFKSTKALPSTSLINQFLIHNNASQMKERAVALYQIANDLYKQGQKVAAYTLFSMTALIAARGNGFIVEEDFKEYTVFDPQFKAYIIERQTFKSEGRPHQDEKESIK